MAARGDASASSPRRCDGLILLTLVSPDRSARIGAAISTGTRIHCLDSWTQLRAASELLPDAIVIDPLICSAPAATLNQALCAVADVASLIVYTSLTPLAMRRMLALPALSGARLILAGLDDGPDALRITFGTIRSAVPYRHALEELERRSGPLPPDVTEALADVLRAGEHRLTVNGLARAAHMSARTLERRLAEAHAPPPLWLIKTTRALLARELLGSFPLTVQEVARRVGYAKLSSLRALLRWSFDASPSLLRRGQALKPGPRWAMQIQPGSPSMMDSGAGS